MSGANSPSTATTTPSGTHSRFGPPGDWKRIAGALSVVLLLTAVSFGLLFFVVIPGHHEINGQIFGIGLAITAYLLGVRHAFDADRSRPSTTPPASSSPTVNDRCPWGCSSPSGTPPWCS